MYPQVGPRRLHIASTGIKPAVKFVTLKKPGVEDSEVYRRALFLSKKKKKKD